MRKLLPIGLIVLLAGCRGTQAYTQEDLRQVTQAYAEIVPTYQAFKRDFQTGNGAGIQTYFRREQRECKVEDIVDNRDTIDPNVNLFAVSVGLDDMCNAIESAYVTWAMAHGLPYDRTIVPGRPIDVFIAADTDYKKMPKQLRHPAALA